MNSFLSLIKTMFKSGSSIGLYSDGDGMYKKVIKTIFMLIVIIPVVYFIYVGTSAIYDQYSLYNMENIIVIVGLCGLSLMVVFFGIFYALGILYFSKDIENYLYLPLKPWKILSGKLMVVLLYEYITLSVMYFPVIVSYGLKDSWGVLSFLLATIVFIMIPIIPLTIASLLVMIIMRFTNIAKKKDSIKFWVSMIILVLLLGLNFGLDYFLEGRSQELLAAISSNRESVVKLAEYIFPSVVFAAKALVGNGLGFKLLNILFYILISIGAYILLVIFGQKIYLKGVVGLSETGGNRKALSDNKFKTFSRRKKVIITYAFKELKILFRVPAYLFNCIVSEVVMIALIIVPLYFKNVKLDGFNQIVSMIESTNADITILVIFCLGVLISSVNAIAITAISREGEQFYVMKYIPISYENQIKAKILAATIVGEVFNIVLILALAFILKLSIWVTIIGLVVSAVGTVLSSFIGVIIDLHLPKLTWDSEQKLIKQNLNVLINLGICSGTAFGISYLLFNWGQMFIPIPVLLVIVVLAIILILYRYISININDNINRISL